MLRTITVRGRKDIVAVFSKYARISGEQDTSRPKATANFIDYISKMPLNEDTAAKLQNAAKHRIDENAFPDQSIPSFIKISVEIEEAAWEKAMMVFRYVFSLKGNPQMPYFLIVAGTAYIYDLEEQNKALSTRIRMSANPQKPKLPLPLEKFKALEIDEKLNEIYKLLLERSPKKI